jgi:hypothetical protein
MAARGRVHTINVTRLVVARVAMRSRRSRWRSSRQLSNCRMASEAGASSELGKLVASKCNDRPSCPICGQLSAVDFIPLALGRARARCQEFSKYLLHQMGLERRSCARHVRPDRLRTYSITSAGDIRRACGQISERSRRGRASLFMVTTSASSLTGVFMRACWGAWCSYALAKLSAFSPLTQRWLKTRAERPRCTCGCYSAIACEFALTCRPPAPGRR